MPMIIRRLRGNDLIIFPRFGESIAHKKGEGGKKSLVKPKLGMLEEQRQHASLNTSIFQQCEYMYKSPCIEIYRHYSYEHIFLYI